MSNKLQPAHSIEQQGNALSSTNEKDKRPSNFSMPIQGGMLEALGINMYTTLGKCLVEFVANAYDSDASEVQIDIPAVQIQAARAEIRTAAKSEVAAGERERFTVLLDTLPENVAVTIKDNGHGMSWQDVESKFLPLNRKRRLDQNGHETATKSESGSRFVMGRKGLGKLAGFGAAERVEVTTKRKGETFSTTIVLEDRKLKSAPNVTNVPIPAHYIDGLNPDTHGTTIRLSGLKSDAVRERLETLEDTIREAFNSLRVESFKIVLNSIVLEPITPDYEFIFPGNRDADGFTDDVITIEDIGEIPIRYFVGFRKRSEHLSAGRRGARIYCNNRLAAGPTLFKLGSGMHSFHSADYMECIVEADELDRHQIDFVNTNRTQLREDNEVVRGLVSHVTEVMRLAIAAHGRFRDRQAKEELANDEDTRVLTQIVATLPKKTRRPAGKLLHVLAVEYGVKSQQFRELAPAFINTVNASEVLVRLIHLQSKPETVALVAEHLRELSEIERADVLKLYRGRRSGIGALKTLWEKGEAEWRKRAFERELHDLLEANPWLIRPEFSNYLTSDEDLNKVVSRIAKTFELDEFAKVVDEDKPDDRRPDLVFLMSDPTYSGPYVINVVELKTPSTPLTIEHWQQLENYLFQIGEWCSSELSHRVNIRGFLIGAMPAHNTSAVGQKRLLAKFAEQGANSPIRITSLQELVDDAWRVHVEAIRVLEDQSDEEEDEEEGDPNYITHAAPIALPGTARQLAGPGPDRGANAEDSRTAAEPS